MSFGRHLQSLRLEKGISLEAVSKQTRISLDNLLLLEKEDHANLPADVFNKGFIRAYAEVLNVDSEEIIQRYVESREAFQATLQDEGVEAIRVKDYRWVKMDQFADYPFPPADKRTMDDFQLFASRGKSRKPPMA